jgi:hypothetical protein
VGSEAFFAAGIFLQPEEIEDFTVQQDARLTWISFISHKANFCLFFHHPPKFKAFGLLQAFLLHVRPLSPHI